VSGARDRRPAAAGLIVLVAVWLAGCGPAPQRGGPKITEEMVRQVVGHPELQKQLHLERNGRSPLLISDHLLEPFVDFPGFAYPVRVVPDATLEKGAFLRFNSIVLGEQQATVGVEYRIEGVGGMFTFSRESSGEWRLEDAQVWKNR
jgi:hypothetical protein